MSFRLNPIVLNDDGSLVNTQMSFFSSYSVLSDRYKRDLQKGWAGLFRTLIMPYIDENPYRVLYSERPCRSNVPVNVLMGAQILKLMKSIPNDDDLREKACYDLEFRYALCCENYEGAPFSDNVLTRFRRACILHYIDTGEDLIHETFDSLKDQFVKLMEIDPTLFSIDSTMIDTWAKDMNRLELLYVNNELMIRAITGVVTRKREPKTTTVKHNLDMIDGQLKFASAPDESIGNEQLQAFRKEREIEIQRAKALLPEQLHRYLDISDKNIITYHSEAPYRDRLNAVTGDSSVLLSFCEEHTEYQAEPYYQTFIRILKEQCKEDGSGTYTVRGSGDGMDSGIVQNPHDPDATYREKDGEKYKGYVTGFTQSKNADGETLVMDYNIEKNNISDQELGTALLMNHAIPDPETRTQCVGDSLFNSDAMQQVATKKNIEIINTNLTGKTPPDHCADHQFDDGGNLTMCAGGVTPESTKLNKDGSCTAKFNKEDCVSCPYSEQCRKTEQVKYNSLKTSTKVKDRAEQIRSRNTDEFKELANFRNGVETIPSFLKNKYHAEEDRAFGLAAKKLSVGFMYIAINVTKVVQFAQRRVESALN